MISLENVVQVFHLTVLHRLRADSLRLQLGDRLGQGGCFIGVDHSGIPGCRIRSQRLGQETLGRRDIALRREIKVQGLPTGGDRPVEIAPPAADPDIGLIHPPGTGLPQVPAGTTVFACPAQARISGPSGRSWCDRLARPARSSFPPERGSSPRSGSTTHCPQNNVTGEMTTGENTHGCDYITSLFLLPQLCNNTR